MADIFTNMTIVSTNATAHHLDILPVMANGTIPFNHTMEEHTNHTAEMPHMSIEQLLVLQAERLEAACETEEREIAADYEAEEAHIKPPSTPEHPPASYASEEAFTEHKPH